MPILYMKKLRLRDAKQNNIVGQKKQTNQPKVLP